MEELKHNLLNMVANERMKQMNSVLSAFEKQNSRWHALAKQTGKLSKLEEPGKL